MTAEARRVTRRYNTFALLSGLLWWLPVFYLYQRQCGLSDEQIFGIQSIYYLAFCLLEIPTGALADRFDYRRFLTAGALTLTVANVLPIVAPNYGGFLAHFLLVALAYSLVSGAGSAYLYEYLGRTGNGDSYQRAEGTARACTLAGRVVCLPAAGVLMQWYAPAPYWLSALGCGAAVVAALRLPPLPSTVDSGVRTPLPVALRGALRTLAGSRLLVLLIVQGVAIFTLVRICQTNLYQPILDAKHLPLAVFGVLTAATTLLEVAGAARSARLVRLRGVPAVLVLTVLMAAFLVLLVPAGLAVTVLCLCCFSFASGLAFPLQRKLVNDAITDTAHRATLLSVESLIDRAVCAFVVLLLGNYLSHGRINEFLIHLAIGTTVLMAVLAIVLRRQNRQADLEKVTVG